MKGLKQSFSFALIVTALALLAGCGGGTPSGVSITVSVSANPSTINAGQTSAVTAVVTNDPSNSGVTWTLSGVGSLSNATKTTVTYNAPTSVTSTQVVSITATSVANTSVAASVNIQVNGTSAITVALVNFSTTINQGGTSALTARVSNDSSNSGVTWTPPTTGTLSNESSTSATYNAPSSVTAPTEVPITATSAKDSSVTATTIITVLPSGGANNVEAVNVDGGPINNYVNAPFASATVCVHGSTTNCTTVDGLLVDTGSIGLRVLGSALGNLSLPAVTLNGANLNNCIEFIDGSFLWGPVVTADVHISGEVASSIPMHVLADPVGYSIPSGCSGTDENSLQGLGANGILGIGSEPVDCGSGCDGSSGSIAGVYWTCTSSGCGQNPVEVPDTQQVRHPVVGFTADNNGTVLNFPAVTSPSQATVSGTLTFGIGTETNNGLGTAAIFTMAPGDVIQTTFLNDNDVLPDSFIDSGSNGFYIPDPNSAIAICSDNTFFFCPSSTLPASAANLGYTTGSNTVNFDIDNADSLFTNYSSNLVFPTLGGPNGTDACDPSTGDSCSFDWGFPFFYNNAVYTAIDGQVVSGAPTTPWWAYTAP